jgi:hypothetical protein
MLHSVMKYGTDESNELHRSAGKIEAKRPEKRRKLSPPEKIHDLRHDEDGEDHHDHSIGELVYVAVLLHVDLNSTMGGVERPEHEHGPEQTPACEHQGIRLRKQIEQYECQKRESSSCQARFEQKTQPKPIARVPCVPIPAAKGNRDAREASESDC